MNDDEKEVEAGTESEGTCSCGSGKDAKDCCGTPEVSEIPEETKEE
jgi:hypothetical protein